MASSVVNNGFNAGYSGKRVVIKRDPNTKSASAGTSTSAYKNSPGPRSATGKQGA